MNRKIKISIQSVIFTFITFGIPAFITVLFPNECWTPRIGGFYVGICVFLQAYMQVNPKKFKEVDKLGISQKEKITHWVYILTIMGTFLWAFGDMFTHVLWVSNGTCLID